MKIVFFGTPQFAVPSLERLICHEAIEVLAVVTQPDKRRGRGNEVTPSPVKALAVEQGLTVWQPQRIKKDETVLQHLRQIGADAFVVVAYGQILSQEILDMPRLGCINAHGSILPRYRGAAPIQWSLYYGEAETGVTTMLMDAGMDTGAMLLKSITPIALTDHALDLAKTLSFDAATLLVDTLFGLEQNLIQPVPQNDAEATYAPLIKKEDYQLDWTRSALDLHNQIRGFYPNCVTQFRDLALKVTVTLPLDHSLSNNSLSNNSLPEIPAELAALQQEWEQIDSPQEAEPGTIVGFLKGQGAVVQTGSGVLLLQEVQSAGKRSQSGWDFVNGMRLQVGERVGV